MRWTGLALLAPLAFIQAEPATAQQILFGIGNVMENCRAEIEQEILNLGISANEIESLNVVEKTQKAGVDDRIIVGWNGWMRPKGIKGYLVVEVSRECVTRNIYTRGDYRVEGVDHY